MNLTRRNFVLGSLGVASMFGLAACGGNTESQALEINLEDYKDMPQGELWIILADGSVDKYENDTGGWAYGAEYFWEEIKDDEIYYSDRYEGATFITHCKVKATMRDGIFENGLELTCDRGYLESQGLEGSTVFTVEVDGDTVSEQGIRVGDWVIAASQNVDLTFQYLEAPTSVLKVEE